MSTVQQVLLGLSNRPDASIDFLQSNSSTTDLTTYTFSGENLGTADSARYIIVGFVGRRSTVVSCAINSVTIGGVSATIVHTQQSADTSFLAGIAIAAVPTGTSGDVVFTWNGTMTRMAFATYRVLNVNPTYEVRGQSVANPLTSTLSCSAGSVMIAVAGTIDTATATWSGTNAPTEDCDVVISDAGRISTASRECATALSVTATCTWTSSNQPTYVSASFAKA